jgi:hypothetical protein
MCRDTRSNRPGARLATPLKQEKELGVHRLNLVLRHIGLELGFADFHLQPPEFGHQILTA